MRLRGAVERTRAAFIAADERRIIELELGHELAYQGRLVDGDADELQPLRAELLLRANKLGHPFAARQWKL